MSVQSGWGRFTWGRAYWNENSILATGWGAKAWNDGEWGNLADETVSLTGIAATSNIGAVGILANALVEPTGVSSTSSTGSISPVIPKTVEVGGVSISINFRNSYKCNRSIFCCIWIIINSSNCVVDPADQVMGLTGLSSTVGQGTAVAPNEDVSVTGQAITSSQGQQQV